MKHHLREAIESIIHQTYDKLEIIIIDDGSTDGSEKICDEYKTDSRVLIIHQDNQGLSNARNKGLEYSTGDIVAFLDSDDKYYPEMIQKMVDEMNKYDVDIVTCSFDWEGHNIIQQQEGYYTSTEALKELIHDRIVTAVWNKIYKADLWKGIKFPDGHVYEGTRVTFKLLERANAIHIIPDRLMFHRNRQGSITQTKSVEHEMDLYLANKEFEKFVIKNTPQIYTELERDEYVEKRLRGMIVQWANNRFLDASFEKALVSDILSRGKNRRGWAIRTRVAYRLFSLCPTILCAGLPVYLKLKKCG